MRKLIVAVIIMFIGTTAFSQGIDIDLGIKAGGNFSNIRNLNSLNLKYRIGLQAGVFAGIKFSERIAIQADVLFSEEGAIVLPNGNFDLTYVNIPVVLKYYIVPGEHFNIQIGPQFGVLVEDNIRVVVDGVEQKFKGSDSDLSGILGVGYDLPMGFQIEGRFHLGFSSVIDDPRANPRLKYFSLTIGYSIL